MPFDRKPAFWECSALKTTLDLPDDLMREVKIRAAREGRKRKDLLAAAIRAGLDVEATDSSPVPRAALPVMKLAKAPGKRKALSLAESCDLVKAAELGTDAE
jgi:plasmid stability protein